MYSRIEQINGNKFHDVCIMNKSGQPPLAAARFKNQALNWRALFQYDQLLGHNLVVSFDKNNVHAGSKTTERH
jgi:hypothetical protein